MNTLAQRVLALLPNIAGSKSTSQAKGWNVPKCVDRWLCENIGIETLEKLKLGKTESGLYSFDKENRAKLQVHFPDHPLIKPISDFHKKSKMLGQLKNLGITVRMGYYGMTIN